MRSWLKMSVLVLSMGCGAEARSLQTDASTPPAFDADVALDARVHDAAPAVVEASACQRVFCPSPAVWNDATCSCQESCDLGKQVAADVPATGTVDCGTLAVNADSAMRAASAQCVVDAIRDHKPFRLIEAQYGTDSIVATGYAGGGVGDLFAIFTYDGDPFGGGSTVNGIIDAQYCRGLTASLSCDEPVAFGRVCDGRPSQAENTCFGPGDYEAGKGGEYRPCCEGLNQVQILTAASAGDDLEHECVQEPLNTYACLAGRCGDGECELAESIVCACPADCPSAVWGPGDAGVDNR